MDKYIRIDIVTITSYEHYIQFAHSTHILCIGEVAVDGICHKI